MALHCPALTASACVVRSASRFPLPAPTPTPPDAYSQSHAPVHAHTRIAHTVESRPGTLHLTVCVVWDADAEEGPLFETAAWRLTSALFQQKWCDLVLADCASQVSTVSAEHGALLNKVCVCMRTRNADRSCTARCTIAAGTQQHS